MAPPDPFPLDRASIRPGDRLCAAVSGGADSVALLLSLHEEKNVLGVGISAAHVHHGLRGEEADGDQAFVEALCARLDVPLHVHHADVPERVRQTGETIEEAARSVRYDFFHSLIANDTTDSVLSAHTLDDQAETVLMKLLRGAWTEGLSGIHPVVDVSAGGRTGKILRPMLAVRRAKVEEFLREAGQPWRDDSTNAETIYTRNRVRHHVLPLLREFNGDLDCTLANLAETARGEEQHWSRTLAQLLSQMLLPGEPTRGGGRSASTLPGAGSAAFDVERLRSLDLATRRRLVRAAARRLGVRLSFDDTTRLLALVDTPVRGNGMQLHLPGGLRAQRSVREIRLSRGKI